MAPGVRNVRIFVLERNVIGSSIYSGTKCYLFWLRSGTELLHITCFETELLHITCSKTELLHITCSGMELLHVIGSTIFPGTMSLLRSESLGNAGSHITHPLESQRLRYIVNITITIYYNRTYHIDNVFDF